MQPHLGSPHQSRLSRRDFVRIGGLTAFGLGLGTPQRAFSVDNKAKAKRAILIWLDGGPSHL